MPKQRRLLDTYVFPPFYPLATVRGLFGDPKARLVKLLRRGKKRLAEGVAVGFRHFTTAKSVKCATCPAETHASTSPSRRGGCSVCSVA